MSGLLRVLAFSLACACLLAAGAWFAADRYATSFVRSELADESLADIVSARSVRLPRPDVARISGATLRDPETGEVVAQVDELEVRFVLPLLDSGRLLAPVRIDGRGGRVMLSSEDGELGLVRAIRAIVARIRDEPGPAEEAMRVPEGELRDVRIILQQPGLELETIDGCTVRLEPVGPPESALARVSVEMGSRRGVVELVFGRGGLRSLSTESLAVSPAFALFAPPASASLAAELRPRGRLDLTLTRDPPAHSVEASGELREAVLEPPQLPFPLERVSLPFRFEEGRFILTDAQVGFPGGELSTSLDHSPAGLSLRLDTRDARLRAEELALIPVEGLGDWVAFEGGARVEMHLVVESRGEGGRPEVSGWGGVMLDRVAVGPARVPIENLVGSFDVTGGRIVFRETTGVCASGLIGVRGELELSGGAFEVEASVYDVDLGLLRRQMDVGDAETPGLSGWLQGSVTADGTLGVPERTFGEGQFSLRAGNLWKVPVLDAVLGALGAGRPEGRERHRLEVRFRLRGLTWRIDELRLESRILSLLGNGSVRAGNELDLDLIPFGMEFGLVGKFLDYLKRQLVKVEVRGTLDDPQVRVLPVKVISGPLFDLWDWAGGVISAPEPTQPAPP